MRFPMISQEEIVSSDESVVVNGVPREMLSFHFNEQSMKTRTQRYSTRDTGNYTNIQ